MRTHTSKAPRPTTKLLTVEPAALSHPRTSPLATSVMILASCPTVRIVSTVSSWTTVETSHTNFPVKPHISHVSKGTAAGTDIVASHCAEAPGASVGNTAATVAAKATPDLLELEADRERDLDLSLDSPRRRGCDSELAAPKSDPSEGP